MDILANPEMKAFFQCDSVQIDEAIRKIPASSGHRYRLLDADYSLNDYSFESKEYIAKNAFFSVVVQSVSNNKTSVIVHASNLHGLFDKHDEHARAAKGVQELINLLGNILHNSTVTSHPIAIDTSGYRSPKVWILIILFIVVAIISGMFFFSFR